MDMKGITAVVTGAASGLGAAAARMFVEGGANVSLWDLDEEGGRKLADDIGQAAMFIKTDVTSGDSVSAAVDQTVARFGGINAAVSCAGIGIPAKVLGKKGPANLEHFSKVVQVNLIGTFNVLRLCAQQMVQNEPNADGEKGVVVNTASVAAFEGQIGQASYSASKGGVVGMTLPIAREFASYGIRVMTIAPGLFDTPMLAALPEDVRDALGRSVPFPKRLGLPAEYAAMVKHIMENAMLNGETIRLDGALRMAAK
jgi:NAD(P)-dependent dehydrogenase (short-subunit alcohol dehydrogenase family)